MRAGYLGPEGTFTHEALTAAAGSEDLDLVALPTIYDTVMAVGEGEVERALVPIENSLEGSVNATLDTLAMETEDVVIVGELVHPIRHCLIARDAIALESIRTVASIPQATAQCARFIRARLRGATVMPANSTADAVRMAAEADGTWAALGNRLAAELYGCEVLQDGVEDLEDNETRFVWLAGQGADSGALGPWKTSVVFWGAGDDAPGWLARCLSEFAFRGVNLTLIESRPRKVGLGHYMFFADLEGRDTDEAVARAITAVRGQTEELRVLGSYPAA
ncbi:MAG TPA: prephenate dehydratase [Solirubrobacteraceae bacterium]|nr:prephenate dehydratase [Solirubrobacteraceae bacterium]